MCYGDINHGHDGYYEQWARQQEQEREQEHQAMGNGEGE
jgi:hypothetical protein